MSRAGFMVPGMRAIPDSPSLYSHASPEGTWVDGNRNSCDLDTYHLAAYWAQTPYRGVAQRGHQPQPKRRQCRQRPELLGAGARPCMQGGSVPYGRWRDPMRGIAGSDIMTVSDVCPELKIARSTFYEWRAKGRAPRCTRLPNGLCGSGVVTWRLGSPTARAVIERQVQSRSASTSSRRTSGRRARPAHSAGR